MTTQTDSSLRDDIIARNLAAVEVHFHNETPETIDKAISVYTDDIVWEVPARGLVHRNVEDVKAEYLKIFGSMNIHKITNLYRFATEEWVFDDSIFEWTITGAPATYLLVFGENYPHFHALIAARGEHVPENLRAGNILKLRQDHADRAAATRLVPDVRRAYQRNAAAPAGGPGRGRSRPSARRAGRG